MNDTHRRRMFGLVGGAMALAGLTPARRALAQATPPGSPGPEPASPGAIRYIEVNGARLAYERHVGGEGRRPLVFVHGYALRSTGPIYAPLIRRLTATFDVHALDLRGHGGSAASFAGWSQAAIADDVAAFVKRLGIRGAVYAGHSLGGFTGLYAQIRHPGTFSALSLLATAAASGLDAPRGLMEAFVTGGRDPNFVRGAFAPMFLHPGPDDVANAVDAVSLIHPSVHETFFPNVGRTDIADRLGEIRVPVLLVNGGSDNVVSPAAQHTTALGLPWSKEVILSREGHMLPIEAPETTAREMMNFFTHDAAGTFAR